MYAQDQAIQLDQSSPLFSSTTASFQNCQCNISDEMKHSLKGARGPMGPKGDDVRNNFWMESFVIDPFRPNILIH